MTRGDKRLVNAGVRAQSGTHERMPLVPLDRRPRRDMAAPPCGRGSARHDFPDDERRARSRAPPTSLAAGAVSVAISCCPARGSRDPLSISLFGISLPCLPQIAIRHETDGDASILSELSAEAFGPGRFARSAYRVREGVAPVAGLSLCAVLDGQVVGGIRFTAIRIGGEDERAAARAAGGRSGRGGQRLRQGAGRAKAWRGRARRASASCCWSATCPITGASASSPCRRGRSRCRARSIPRGCLRSSLCPARSQDAAGVRSEAMRASGLRGTRSRRAARAGGRARGGR